MTEVIIVGNETDEISYTKNEVNDYFSHIQTAWHKVAHSIISTAMFLAEARMKLDGGKWSDLKRKLEDDKVMSGSTISKLLGIAQNNVLTKVDYLPLLPSSYETLYFLSRQDEVKLEDKIVSKEIGPDSLRKDVVSIFVNTSNKVSKKKAKNHIIISGDTTAVPAELLQEFKEILKKLKQYSISVKGLKL